MAILALFFACWSYEYTIAASEHKTKVLCLGDIRFSNDQAGEIPHDHLRLLNLEFVSCTFRNQKNNEKFEIVTQQATSDLVLNPVR